MNLRGKVALVTGASRGIGRAIALAFAEKGCNVGINFVRNREKALETLRMVKERGAEGILLQADVSKYDQVKQMVDKLVEKFGRIDILVNNAGITSPLKPIEEITDEEWDRIMNINLKGAFNCCKAVIPYMIKQGGGKIINISSSAGLRGGRLTSVPYAASKAGLHGLTFTLAHQLAKYNILVNAIAPRLIKTEILEQSGMNSEFIEKQVKSIPVGRMGEPEEVAHAVIFLAENDYITATIIPVCGGAVPH